MKIALILCLILVFSPLCLAAYSPLYEKFRVAFEAKESNIWPEANEHGFIPVGKNGDDIFYWFFPSRQSRAEDPLVIWLSGGPGCSSEIAAFFENGPMTVKGSTIGTNPNAWNNKANLIYFDSPVGTGFSKSAKIWDLKTNEQQIAENLYETISGFIAKNPEFKGRELYVTGESYAGHYIPFFGKYLHDHKADNTDINFKGVGIGNGLVDPVNQYDAYATFAYHNGLISKPFEMILTAGLQVCKLVSKIHIPILDVEICNIMIESVLGNPIAPKFNVYDIRKKCDKPPLCYDFSDMDNLLKRKDVVDDLQTKGRNFQECNMIVHLALITDWSTNGSPAVAELADAGYKVLVYNGDKDYICNWEGGQAWINKMQWKHLDEFKAAGLKDCDLGSCQEYANVKFVKFADAGHMVPMDQPENALKMINELISKA